MTISGFKAALYYSDVRLTGRPGDAGNPKTYLNVTWNEITHVMDFDQDEADESIDITPRKVSERGYSTEAGSGSTIRISWRLRWEPGKPGFAALREASIFNRPMSLLEMDNDKSILGSQGYVGNWVVTLGMRRPVKGIQVVDCVAVLSEYPDHVEKDSTQLLETYIANESLQVSGGPALIFSSGARVVI